MVDGSAVELILPLFRQASWTNHKTTLQIARAMSSLIKSPAMIVLPAPGHLRAKTGVADEEHFAIDRGNLMRKRLYHRGMDS